MIETREHPGRNRLLANLPCADIERLFPFLRREQLDHGAILYRPNQPIASVYFPLTAMISMLTVFDDGSMVESGVIGNEGVAGLPVYFGVDSMTTECLIQAPGDLLVMDAAVFRDEVSQPGPLREIVGRYAQALFSQLAQTAACNRAHPLEERLARWLLMTHDRVGSDELQITHEFLGQMLGVRRAGVTVAAGILQRAGIIAYRRGRVRVLDRKRLEAASCECYRSIRDEFDRLLG